MSSSTLNIIPYVEIEKAPEGAIQIVRPRHREMMRRVICGDRHSDIARDAGISVQRFNIIYKSPLFQSELRKMEQAVQNAFVQKQSGALDAKITRTQEQAVDLLSEIIEHKGRGKGATLTLAQKSARDILSVGVASRKNKNDEGMNDVAAFITQSFEIALAQQREILAQEQAALAATAANAEGSFPIDAYEVLAENPEDEALLTAGGAEVTEDKNAETELGATEEASAEATEATASLEVEAIAADTNTSVEQKSIQDLVQEVLSQQGLGGLHQLNTLLGKDSQ